MMIDLSDLFSLLSDEVWVYFIAHIENSPTRTHTHLWELVGGENGRKLDHTHAALAREAAKDDAFHSIEPFRDGSKNRYVNRLKMKVELPSRRGSNS